MKAALCVALALLLAGCSDSTGTAGGLRITTSASAYTLDARYHEAGVVFTVKNTGSTPLTLPDCGGGPGSELQQQQQGTEWVTVGGGICLPVYVSGPMTLAPGESAMGATAVRATGVYRIRVMILGSGDEEPPRYAVSRNFVAG